jgi:hypothetical protein
MGLFKKKSDPINARSRELNAKISELESKISRLNNELQSNPGPRVRSTSYPDGATVPASPAVSKPRGSEPIFEKVDQNPWKAPEEPPTTPQHYNELGVRKYDLLSFWERIKKQFRGAPVANPKLVNYLAAGSIQGLRPLRYEKRVARNRFILLAVVFVLVMLGIFFAVEHRH